MVPTLSISIFVAINFNIQQLFSSWNFIELRHIYDEFVYLQWKSCKYFSVISNIPSYGLRFNLDRDLLVPASLNITDPLKDLVGDKIKEYYFSNSIVFGEDQISKVGVFINLFCVHSNIFL